MSVETTNAGYILAAAYAADPVSVTAPDPSKHESQRGINSYVLSQLSGVTADVANSTFQVGDGVLFVDYTVGTELFGLFGATPVVQAGHDVDPTDLPECIVNLTAINVWAAAYGFTAAA